MTDHVLSVKRILIVEDDADVRMTTAEALLDVGYQVDCAADGQEALWHIEQNRHSLPGLIICDLTMPRMDGLQFLTWMWGQRDLPDIPTLVVTGSGRSVVTLEAGAFIVGSLSKPFAMDTLLETVARYVMPEIPDHRSAAGPNGAPALTSGIPNL
ncbi:MAG: response regulator [Candidatus Sericytochromatia bacterium]|nr:response regulator [Candidatus Sericytochromatia bacterium]